MLKSTGTRCSSYMQAKAVTIGMRIKEQHEGKGKGWACNNHNMRNSIIKDAGRGYACYDCCMPIPCLCLHAAPYFFCLHIATESCSCTEEQEEGFWQFTYVIAVVYFTTFDSFIVYRNTHRPCYMYVSKMAYNCSIWELGLDGRVGTMN